MKRMAFRHDEIPRNAVMDIDRDTMNFLLQV